MARSREVKPDYPPGGWARLEAPQSRYVHGIRPRVAHLASGQEAESYLDELDQAIRKRFDWDVVLDGPLNVFAQDIYHSIFRRARDDRIVRISHASSAEKSYWEGHEVVEVNLRDPEMARHFREIPRDLVIIPARREEMEDNIAVGRWSHLATIVLHEALETSS